MTNEVVWHGTPDEATQLIAAVGRNCTCELTNEGVRASTCAAHRMVLDQATLDRLLFARYMAQHRILQETSVSSLDGVEAIEMPQLA